MNKMSISSLVRACLLAFLVVGVSWQSASAQSTGYGRSVMYHGFAGAGFASGDESIWNAGFGGEAFVYKGLTIGADLGYLASFDFAGEGFGNLNVNGSYHFLNGQNSQKWVPFVTGGYTLFFAEGAANLFNVGGGVTYWKSPNWGLRFEVRDQIWSDYNSSHYVSFSVGFVF